MKKFFYVALLALVMGSFFSCAPGTDGKKPEIDETNGTINGVPYPNETAACWKITFTISASAAGHTETDTEDEYMWGTMFEAYKYAATAAYEGSGSVMGVATKITYVVLPIADRTESTCYESYGN